MDRIARSGLGVWLLGAVAFALLPPAAAQSHSPEIAIPDNDEVIRQDVSLVSLTATVRAKNGSILTSLVQPDFHVFEDGKERPIRFFARESDVPLTIGMLIDVSGSMAELIPEERLAGAKFFEQVLRPRDKAFLIGVGVDSTLVQDTTNSVKQLESGLADLQLSLPSSSAALGFPGRRTQAGCPPVPAGTVLYDAVLLAAKEKLRGVTGRKMIIVLTDGLDNGSCATREAAIRAAQESDAMIYGIYFDSHSDEIRGDAILNRMALDTGGRLFEVTRRTKLQQVFRQIEDEIRGQYSILFAPMNMAKNGSYHEVKLKVAQKDSQVQVRRGYYAVEK